MPTSLITENIWSRITETARRTKSPSYVAVAYFGTRGSQLLPLRRGSRLVVDASEKAMKSGQTNPTALLAMLKKGVAVYSLPNLHAKVFVFGARAFVGSTNASDNRLIEAVLLTTESEAVACARQFVRDLCLNQLTPNQVTKLITIYREPHFPGGGGKVRRVWPELPRLKLAQLHAVDWTKQDRIQYEKGFKAAKKQRERKTDYIIDAFWVDGECPYEKQDKVIQITEEGMKPIYVTPPGNVSHIRRYHTNRGFR